jgi:hypothetical protein
MVPYIVGKGCLWGEGGQSGGHNILPGTGSLTVLSLCSNLPWFLNDAGSLIYIKQVTEAFLALRFPLGVLKLKKFLNLTFIFLDLG